MRKTGIAFVIVAWGILLWTALGAPLASQSHPHMDSFAQPWPVALGTILPAVGIVLTAVPLRRRERWSFWTLLLTFAALLVGRFLSDPRCMVVLDPHQHGCHTFMIAIVLGIIGVIMAR
jgi:uncharacterized membrane protein HdeD (DUF308 family)